MSGTEDLAKGLYTNLELAQAYIPIQTYGNTFDPKTALMRGTLFPELYKPYTMRPKA